MRWTSNTYSFVVGDFMGVAGAGDAFALTYATTTPEGDPARTAVFFTTVMPP